MTWDKIPKVRVDRAAASTQTILLACKKWRRQIQRRRAGIGGEMIHAGSFVLDAVIQSARRHSFAPSFEATEIVADEITEGASATGAALLANER